MIEKMGDVIERIRLVVLGGSRVGKSAIVKRFLSNTFEEKYKTTVEELYSKEYDIGRITLKVDILDTAGDLQFPAMRRLSIATAHAFLLVYSVDDAASFDTIKSCFQEIKEQRQDFAEIPILVAGNKNDVDPNNVQVEFDDVSDWISQNFPDMKTKILECSAKRNANIKEVFRSFLELSKTLLHMPDHQEPEKQNEDGNGTEKEVPGRSLRRRLSAHGWAKSTDPSPSNATTPTKVPTTPVSPRAPLGGFFTPPKTPSSPSTLSPNYLSAEDNSPFGRNKPRSRSLIRRCSKKVKKQVQDATEGPGECQLA